MSTSAPANPLSEYFLANPGRLIHKWRHYFDPYHRHLARFRGASVTLLEFGVFHGGSLQMWKHYLGDRARIVGVDIRPQCKAFEEDRVTVRIGDQADRAFLRQLAEEFAPIDIAIDDGGHRMGQQIATFEEIFPRMSDEGCFHHRGHSQQLLAGIRWRLSQTRHLHRDGEGACRSAQCLAHA